MIVSSRPSVPFFCYHIIQQHTAVVRVVSSIGLSSTAVVVIVNNSEFPVFRALATRPKIKSSGAEPAWYSSSTRHTQKYEYE